METILLLGANGQVGFELHRALAPLGRLIAATRNGQLLPGMDCARVDLATPAALAELLDRVQPTLIVNAAAYTAVDRAEQEPGLAQRINADVPAQLGQWAALHAAAVVHYSTDYVFAGDADSAYSEADITAPLGAYGCSKLAGEQALDASGAGHIILRTAWVYAARGHNFFLSMLRLARERDELRVVADQFGAPTPAALIAHASAALLAQWLVLNRTDRITRGGLYHLTSTGQASWYEFACAIVSGAQRIGLLERAPQVVPISSAQYPTPAQRPTWSVLDCTRVQTSFNLCLPSWQAGLDSVLVDLKANSIC